MKRKELSFIPEFFDRYILRIDEETLLLESLHNTQNIFRELKDDLSRLQDYQYQSGKWTPKDILQHVIDTERIMTYRALAIARGEQQKIGGFDQNEYANHVDTSSRSLDSLLYEYESVRNSSIILFENFDKNQLCQCGICSDIKMTPLALGFIIAGHAVCHIDIFKERYMN